MISSSAVRVCFCLSGKPNCSPRINHSVKVLKGEAFSVPIIAVNQVEKAVSATIISKTRSQQGYLDHLQTSREISNVCTNLTFNVYSLEKYSDMVIIFADGPCRDIGVSKSTVQVFFNKCVCPVGFECSENCGERSCKCDCHHEIRHLVKECNQSTQSFFREDDFWIRYANHSSYRGYVTYSNCPFDYCRPPRPGVWINLNIAGGQDGQCSPHRTGVLCGKCQPGYTLSAGSLHCITCNKLYPLFSTIFSLGVAIAGIVLVILILALNLTVAAGTITTVIFYANLVSINHSIFLPFSTPNLFTLFIAWLNLSIGFDICFYRGMDSYAKTWLLFVFPTYVVLLIITVIQYGRYSQKFTHLIAKRNPIATLATLLLLSFTKLLQTSIGILSFAVLRYPDGSNKLVWLPDANVKYFSGIHFPLFLLALFITVIGLAYTVVLFSWQWLLRLPRTRATRWLRSTKLNSFVYTYHVPYRAQYRCWPGLLLLARIVVYLIVNVVHDPRIKLLGIILTATCLLVLKAVLSDRVCRSKLIDCLDTFSILNILVFSLASFYSVGSQQSQEIAAYISVGVAIMTFIFVITYHIITKFNFKESSWLNTCCFKQRRQRQTLAPSTGESESNLGSTMPCSSSEVAMTLQHTETSMELLRVHDNTGEKVATSLSSFGDTSRLHEPFYHFS